MIGYKRLDKRKNNLDNTFTSETSEGLQKQCSAVPCVCKTKSYFTCYAMMRNNEMSCYDYDCDREMVGDVLRMLKILRCGPAKSERPESPKEKSGRSLDETPTLRRGGFRSR